MVRTGSRYMKAVSMRSQDKETGYEQVAPTVYALVAAIDAKDSFTFQHSTNVSQYAVLLAQKLGLSRKRYPDRKGGRPFA